MIVEKQITTTLAGDKQIRQLYQTAFPKEEQIPYEDLRTLITTMHLDFTAYYDGEQLMGFTIVWPREKFNWFWYFAVREELRGKGHGQQILSRLIRKYDGYMNILDMESPEQLCENTEQRKRRHAFYLRNGFRDTGIGKSFDGIDYTIMMNGTGTFSLQDYECVLSELRSFWRAMPIEENKD